MKRFLLDTDICIEMIRGRAALLLGRLRRRRIGAVGISVITLAELQYGVSKSSNPAHNSIALAHFVAPLNVLPFEHQAASQYGRLRAALERAGHRIGALDMLIAAHAMSLSFTLVTRNEREFRRVGGLNIENWLNV